MNCTIGDNPIANIIDDITTNKTTNSFTIVLNCCWNALSQSNAVSHPI